jgi:hypothetical protein
MPISQGYYGPRDPTREQETRVDRRAAVAGHLRPFEERRGDGYPAEANPPSRRIDRRDAVEEHLAIHGGRRPLRRDDDALATMGAPRPQPGARRDDAAEQPAQDTGPMSIRMNHGSLRGAQP